MIQRKSRMRLCDNPLKSYKFKYSPAEVLQQAQQAHDEHINNPTLAEMKMAEILRENGIRYIQEHIFFYADNHKFILADFFLPDANVVIEVDGPTHRTQSKYDTERDDWHKMEGRKTLRFTNKEVLKEEKRIIEAVLEAISRG